MKLNYARYRQEYFLINNYFMKNFVLTLTIILCLSIACKKEGPKEMRFSISYARSEDSIYSDSVAFAVINYSDLSEFKDTTDLNNPDIFSHSIKVENPYSITMPAGGTCVIKKFDLVSKSGNVIFYIPYRVQYYYINNIRYTGMALPFPIRVADGTWDMMVTKK